MRNVIHPNEINEAINCNKSEKQNLYVGLCGTEYCGSDRWPMVITEVISPKCVRVAGMTYEDYESYRAKDENGNEYLSNVSKYVRVNAERTKIEARGDIYKLRKNGRWIREGRDLWATGAVHFGEADEYRDPSF